MQKKYDLFFAVSLIVMVVIAVHLVNHYVQKQDLDNYLNLLENKISEMIPAEDKQEFQDIYTEFIIQVEDEELPMQDVEKLAARIVELRKKTDTLSAVKLKEILDISKIDMAKNREKNIVGKVNLKWKKLAKDFEDGFKVSDSIRIKRENYIGLKTNLEKQLQIHADITANLKINHHDVFEKVELFKAELDNINIRQDIIDEMEILRSDNINLNSKISALDDIEKVMSEEKRRLEQELNKIDSAHSLN